MRLISPGLAIITWILLLAQVACADDGVVCEPFGLCEPCPEDALHQPFCQPFGNRRLMHCSKSNSTSSNPESESSTSSTSESDHERRQGVPQHAPGPIERPSKQPKPEDDADKNDPGAKGETLAWSSCGRIPAKERADFYEFVACNVLFALVALGGVYLRSRRMRMGRAKILAARIGLGRGGS